MEKKVNIYAVSQDGPNVDSNIDAEGSTLPIRVSCGMCRHEIPLSEAVVPEALDYVVHFCGLDCYERWRLQIDAA
jgi:hypothetical protein